MAYFGGVRWQEIDPTIWPRYWTKSAAFIWRPMWKWNLVWARRWRRDCLLIDNSIKNPCGIVGLFLCWWIGWNHYSEIVIAKKVNDTEIVDHWPCKLSSFPLFVFDISIIFYPKRQNLDRSKLSTLAFYTTFDNLYFYFTQWTFIQTYETSNTNSVNSTQCYIYVLHTRSERGAIHTNNRFYA